MLQPKPFGTLIRLFFSDHLGIHKNASPQTIASYRDTFQLLIYYIKDIKGIEPSRVTTSDITSEVVLSFLDYLESVRGNAINTRNARLAAIRSFFRAVALYDPTCVDIASKIMMIPSKRATRKVIPYLSRSEIGQILKSPNQSTYLGLRDYTLLLTLYNTGARVSEIIAIQQDQINLGTSSYIRMNGKGRKMRIVPLWNRTNRGIKTWLKTLNRMHNTKMLFVNSRGKPLSRHGVDYLLKGHVQQAAQEMKSLSRKKVSPHVIRHSTAMHLLQSGVDLASIAMWLGHESIETTHIYVESDLTMKKKTISKLKSPKTPQQTLFRPKESVIEYLSRL